MKNQDFINRCGEILEEAEVEVDKFVKVNLYKTEAEFKIKSIIEYFGTYNKESRLISSENQLRIIENIIDCKEDKLKLMAYIKTLGVILFRQIQARNN